MGLEGIGLPGNKVLGRRGYDGRSPGSDPLWIAWHTKQYYERPPRYWGSSDWGTVHRYHPDTADRRLEATGPGSLSGNQIQSDFLARLGRLPPGYLWSD